MKFKIVPEPRSVEDLRRAARALPSVPRSEDDCCARLVADASVDSRDGARELLTFMRALGLVAVSDGGFHRMRPAPDDDALAAAFRERVFAADAVLAALETGPVEPAEAFERVRGDVPPWERQRHENWEREWTDRVGRLLEWAVALDLAERVAGDGATARYRAV